MEPSPAPRSFLRTAALVSLGVFVVIAAINWRFYFATPFFEQGDIAVNALQIQRAKHGAEILGNYSRFHFNHPGPVFFYVYALGERVLLDGLHAVPSPHNAHSLAGLLLQSCFFGLALALFDEALGSPLFLPLALAFAAVHFGLAREAFTSVWPPHVLLMPFLCFFAACVSVAGGRGSRLALAVVAGGFLAHGHVAQPLFVVGLFLVAYGLLWSGASRPPWRDFPRAHLVSAAILALFLVPMAADWLRWPNDNLALIVRHLRDHPNEHKTLAVSVLYFLSFFCYLDNQAYLFPEGTRPRHFLLGHVWWYVAWIALAAFIAWRWPRGRVDLTSYRRKFLRAAAILWGAAALLCLEWGIMQNGEMAQFNGYFYFALLFVPLLLAAAALADLAGPKARPWLAGILLAAAAFGATRAFAIPVINRPASGLDLLDATRGVLRADPHPAAPKVLVFTHDDWPAVATAALALARDDIPFQVGSAWGFMFGDYRDLPSQLPAPTIDGATVWRFLRHPPPGVGVPFTDTLRVAFSAGRVDPGHGLIEFTKDGNWEQFQLAGFTSPDHTASYTNQLEAVLQVADSPAARDVLVGIRASPFLSPHRIPAQPMDFWVNGEFIGREVLSSPEVRDVAFRVPAAVWNRRRVVFLVMRFPAAKSPAQLHINGDPRILGWEIRKVTFQYAP